MKIDSCINMQDRAAGPDRTVDDFSVRPIAQDQEKRCPLPNVNSGKHLCFPVQMKTTLVVGIVVLCYFAFVAGCTVPAPPAVPETSATLIASHKPLHPDNTQPVTFKAEAIGDNINRVVLAYQRYDLSGPENQKQQTLVEGPTTVNTCNRAGSVNSLTCEYTMTQAFPANSLIAFTATALDANGQSLASDSYSFASGDYPWLDDPIPVRVNGESISHMDVIFIPDTDITIFAFRDSLDEVIENLYFKYDLIKDFRGLYNFYYSDKQGHYEMVVISGKPNCIFTNPSNMATLEAKGDTIAFLHKTQLRDCKSGKKISSEIDYDKTLIHESGHALFGLQDEYCCDSNYTQLPDVPNIWNSLVGCESEASDVGHPATNCTQLSRGTVTRDFWYIDPTSPPPPGSIMGSSQHESNSDFGKASRRRILWRYLQCFNGNCLQIQPEAAELSATIAASANAENTFNVGELNLTPQLAVEVEITPGGTQVITSSIIHVPVQLGDTLGNDLAVRFQAGDEVVAAYSISDPRLVELEDQQNLILPIAEIFIYVPFSSNLTELQIRPLTSEGQSGNFSAEFEPLVERINLAPLIQQACEEQSELDECQEVLERE